MDRHKKRVKSGESIKIGNNYYQFDSIINSNTWFNTDKNLKFARVYPIDPIIRNKKYEVLENLFNYKELEKYHGLIAKNMIIMNLKDI